MPPKEADDGVDDASAADSPPSTAEVKDPSNPAVLDKYKQAAVIATSTIQLLSSLCVPPATPLELCAAGDKHVEAELAKTFTRDKKVEKGLAFPCCVSVNNVVGHVSPLSTDKDKGGSVKDGDVVKLDLAVHIDGYIAAVSHTVLVGAAKPDGKKADLLLALSACHDAILRCLRVGAKSAVVTDVIAKVCRDFQVTPVQGVLSHNLDRFVLDGPRVILNRAGSVGAAAPAPAGDGAAADEKKDERESKVEEFDFKLNDVFAIDIVLSSGEGKPKPLDDVTIFKRNSQSSYQLKMQISRSILSAIDKRSPVFPFTLRHYDESKARFAMKECRQHDLVHPYPVLREKDSDLVVQSKFVVHVTERGAVKLAGLPVDVRGAESSRKVTDEDVKKLLQQSVLLPVGGVAGAGGGGASSASAAAKAKKKKQAARRKAKAAEEGGKAAADDKTAAAAGRDDDGDDDDDNGDSSAAAAAPK